MLLVIAAAQDVEAHAVVARLGCERAVLLEPRDLSRAGWSLASSGRDGTIVASARRLSAGAISGVLTRRLAIYPQELPHVAQEDRVYVAAEMTALLTWWLGTVPVPVMNRPGAGALCGPGWRPEQWLACASALGLPVVPLTRAVPGPVAPAASPLAELVVVGETVIGDVPGVLADRARRLAQAAATPLLWAGFDASGPRGRLVGVHALPRLTDTVVEAVARYIRLA